MVIGGWIHTQTCEFDWNVCSGYNMTRLKALTEADFSGGKWCLHESGMTNKALKDCSFCEVTGTLSFGATVIAAVLQAPLIVLVRERTDGMVDNRFAKFVSVFVGIIVCSFMFFSLALFYLECYLGFKPGEDFWDNVLGTDTGTTWELAFWLFSIAFFVEFVLVIVHLLTPVPEVTISSSLVGITRRFPAGVPVPCQLLRGLSARCHGPTQDDS